jgi:hypothetical protein
MQATPRATRTQRSSSVPPTHTPLVDIDGEALIKKLMGLSVFVFAAFGVYSIWNAKQQQDAQKSRQVEAKVDEQLSDDHAKESSSPRSPFVLPPEERIPTSPESSAQSAVTPDDPSSSPRSRFAPPTN